MHGVTSAMDLSQWLDLAQLGVLGQIAFSMALGAVLGVEREIADKPAGLRTHMLVAGASTLLVCLGGAVVESVQGELETTTVRSDPLRTMEAVITGISFLGAGSIIRQRSGRAIGGLTTAASLLLSGGLGMCVALHRYQLALGLTLLVVFTLRAVAYVEWKWLNDLKPPAEPDSPDD